MRTTYKCIGLINAKIYAYIKKEPKEEIKLPGQQIKFAQNENMGSIEISSILTAGLCSNARIG